MFNTTFLNAARLDFNNNLDFSALAQLTKLTLYDSSSNTEILDRLKDQQIVITKELPVGRDLISQFPPSVKLICEAGTGYNNIDIAAAREKNIDVCNVPSYSTDAVAQLAITFILNLSISLSQQQNMLHNDNFENFTRHMQVPLTELSGKTLGVIGFGSIAQKTVIIAKALGMKVIVNTRTPKPEIIPDIEFVDLDNVLKRSDYLSLHCPLTTATKHLLDLDKLKLMKPSAFVINTSRGALIKETDLIEALQKGIVAGAGLDVQEIEPPEPGNPLYKMSNVILTPHIGWKRLETRQRLINVVAENIKAFIDGAPVNIVNK